MTADYKKSHLSPNKGPSYHAKFTDDPYRSMVWQLEKIALDRILTTFYKNSEIHQLDFACGTGRILSHLEDRTCTAIGVDLSPSMLAVARTNIKSAEIYQADLTRNDVLGDRKFNLITAFRFFANAELELRLEAMQVLAKHLHDNGYLVFNNHKNTGSTRNRAARLFGRHGYKGMSIGEARALLAENSLKIVKTCHLCVFPASERHMLLPRSLLWRIERFFARISVFSNFGENILYVCKRANN